MMMPSVKVLEKKIAKFFGAPYAVAVDCCTHGVELCLRYVKANAVESPAQNIPIHTISSKKAIASPNLERRRVERLL